MRNDPTLPIMIYHFYNDHFSFIERRFSREKFTNNGPLALTKALENICRTTDRNLMTSERCEGFRLYARDLFYAVAWKDFDWFFNPEMTDHTLALVNNSSVIHVWNDVSKNRTVKIGDKAAYEVIARKYCPKVYNSRVSYEYF